MLSDVMWRSLFRDMVAIYADHIQVFTDGSVKSLSAAEGLRGETRSGCAVFSADFHFKVRLPNFSPIFTCELYAIFLAVNFAASKPGKYIIFTDSLSSIHALESPHLSKHHLIIKTAMILKNHFDKIVIQWIPSHMGIHGNEMADLLAGESLESDSIVNMPLHYKDLYYIINNTAHTMWVRETYPNPNTYFNCINPNIPIPFGCLAGREQQVKAARLFLRCCNLTHSHHFLGTPPPVCERCNIRMSLYHAFLVCPDFNSPRAELFEGLQADGPVVDADLLSGKVSPVLLIKFLKDTNLYKLI